MPTDTPRILLVDDEESVQKLLSYPLRSDGYEVVAATDGQEALDRFDEGQFDLVVLDVMLPRVDGFDVCRQLRARSAVPIIMLTAKAEEFDKVLGLELGADDYITKPFSMREFRSRVKAVLRRAELVRSEEGGDEPLVHGALSVDDSRRAVEVRGEPVRLTYVEFEILSALARAPGPGLLPHDAAGEALGRLLVPRPAHHRRPHPSPAREDRARPQVARVTLHRARGRLPLPRR